MLRSRMTSTETVELNRISKICKFACPCLCVCVCECVVIWTACMQSRHELRLGQWSATRGSLTPRLRVLCGGRVVGDHRFGVSRTVAREGCSMLLPPLGSIEFCYIRGSDQDYWANGGVLVGLISPWPAYLTLTRKSFEFLLPKKREGYRYPAYFDLNQNKCL